MNKNLRIISIIFSSFFIILISTLVYFLVFKSNYYKTHELNKRIYKEREKFIRGSIVDRDDNLIAYTDNGKRIYPYGDSFLHPVGYISKKYGISGLEASLDSYLKEPKGILDKIKIFFGADDIYYGSSVRLTLIADLQREIYNILGDFKGSVVLMNPSTGEIYALVSKPSFNPNDIDNIFEDLSKREDAPFYNRAINGKYPPGSIFKVITSVAALESINGVNKRIFEDKGFIYFNENERLYNQDKKAYNNITLKEAFINSSNVVFGNLSLELGNDKLNDFAERFYFNRDLNLKFLKDSKSYFPKLSKYEKGLIAQSGIGQGDVLITPLTMGIISSAVANKGVIVKPYIVKNILDSGFNIINKSEKVILGRAMSVKTSNTLTDYMKGVVNNNLSHIKGLVDIKAAGKTGTADHKKDNKDGVPHSIFIGFAPYDNPKISIATIIEEGGNGSGIASEISSKIMKRALELIKE